MVTIIRSIFKKLLVLAALICVLCFAGAAHASAANPVASAKTVTGGQWVTVNGKKKYQYEDGTYAKKVWLNIDGCIYRFNKNGYVRTGWFKLKGSWYYADKNGRLAVDTVVCTNGKYYYVNEAGVRVTSTWVTVGKKKYYYGSDGVQYRKKWLKYNGKYYYFKKKGVMAVSRWVGSYYVGEDGARMTNCTVDGYYLDATGKRTVKYDYIFVGDSRIVGMQSAYSASNAMYIAEVGKGYSWLKSTGGAKLTAYLDKCPDTKVVFALGINDLGNIQNYITYYTSLMKSYPDTEFYFLSVNPVNQTKAASYGYSVTNAQITTFNTKLKAAFSSNYVDTYTYLTNNGFDTTDGIHYTSATYIKLYQYLIGRIG